MKQNNSGQSVCPCCERRCSADDLQCRRGMEYFGRETGEHSGRGRSGDVFGIKDEAAALMLKCGHYLHHGLTEKNEDVLSFLSENEKNELTKLLKKCIENWNFKGAC